MMAAPANLTATFDAARPDAAAAPLRADRVSTVPRVCIVGPLPPPSGGMANQCEQLLRLLSAEGIDPIHVRTNSPYRPAWVGRVPMLRALARLLPYLWQLRQGIARAQVVHLLANSGWAWHLLAWPAIVIAGWQRRPVIVNYRGGLADSFLAGAPAFVRRALASVSLRVTPSVFLQQVFARHGLGAEVIPNIIDLGRFSPAERPPFGDAPHLIVTRNLEPIYDIPTAIHAFAQVRQRFAGARLTVAGSGPERAALEALVESLSLRDCVRFAGRIDNAAIPALYASADCLINASTVDNMPISILEAFASGVPVVSTRAGGIPDLVTDGVDGLLVPIGDAQALADGALRVLGDAGLADALRRAGLARAQDCSWPQVREQWLAAYRRVAAEGCPA